MSGLEEKEVRWYHGAPSPSQPALPATPLAEAAVAKDPEDNKLHVLDKELRRSASLSSSERIQIAAQSQSAVSAIPHAKWYRKLNPLRLRRIPPLPEKRAISREYGAGFWSMITFQWMAPLMTVSLMPGLLQFASLVGRSPDQLMTSRLAI
jgi:hypothetical protein